MAEQDALSNFDFSKVTGSGKYVKFEAGKALTLRILTTDPIVFDNVFEDKNTGEQSITTKFAFIVYNFTDGKAQILQATPNMAKKIGELHTDQDFGANIRKIDIKITPTGEKLERRYDIQVLPKVNDLTADMIAECQAIDLDAEFENGSRMHIYDPGAVSNTPKVNAAEALGGEPITEEEPINLDDIPF